MLAIQRLVALSLLVFNGVNIGCIQAEAGAHQDGVRDVEAAACLTAAPAGFNPPVAFRRPKVLNTAAGKVVDEHHWLRDDTHSDPEVLGYLTAENAYSDAALAQVQPLADRLAAEMEARLVDSSAPVPARQGGWWYYERQEPGQRFWTRYRQPALAALPGAGKSSCGSREVKSKPGAGSHGGSGRSRAAAKGQGQAEQAAAAAADSGPVWSDSGPHPAAPEQVVLDPDMECDKALRLSPTKGTTSSSNRSSSVGGTSTSSSGAPEHCDVYGSTVSPDGRLVAFGVDVSGGEQYQLLVRNIASGQPLLPAPIPATNGDYEWAADSRALFYVTRNGSTNRPSQVWYVRLPGQQLRNSSSTAPSAPVPLLLWEELNPAFYLSLSRSSSGRFLLLSSASEVTQQVLLLDLQSPAGQSPSRDSWLAPAPQQQGVQQQVVGHWQSWLFLLVVSPRAPNGELLVAPISNPQQHTVLLSHRREVEVEEVRLFAHHLVLAERQLGHTTITVYCLPANSSAAASLACRYNSTAASAAEAVAEAAGHAAAASSRQGQAVSSNKDNSKSAEKKAKAYSGSGGSIADVAILEAASQQQLDLANALPLLNRGAADAHHRSGTFVVIRGRAGSAPADQDSPMGSLLEQPVAVERQQPDQHERRAARRQQAVAAEGGGQHGSHSPTQQPSRKQPGNSKAGAAGKGPAAGQTGKPGSGTGKAPSEAGRGASRPQPPVLSPDNSWQVAFEEDAYSVGILDSGDWASPVLRLSYTSFTTPHTVVDIDMHTQRRVVRSVAAVGGGFRASDYRSYRLWATAPDGVEVPLSLVYRLDSFGRDGRNPALLMVYGAYGTKYDPEWDSRLLSLLDRGWVVGIVHVRGGGELGYAWHAAGRLDAKPHSFSDLLAAVSTLLEHNITSASRLAVWGRSAGGLTAAAAINSAPHMFHAALLDVPFLDVVGDLVDPGLPLTVKDWDEWGDLLNNASQAAIIQSYSPVHNVVRGVRYPHMLVTAGLMDKRVGYWEAAKWVAQLRAAAEGNGTNSSSSGGGVGDQVPGHHQLLLRTDMSGGHFSTGGSGSSLDDAALKYAFLIATLPSCGSPAGLTGPDVPCQQQQSRETQRQPGSIITAAPLVGSSGSELGAVMSALPEPLHQLLLGVIGLMVASGLMTVLWHASRVWWPLAVNPAHLAALDCGVVGSEPCTPGCKAAADGSCCNVKPGAGREVLRRVSTASSSAGSSASDWQQQQQQRPSVSIGEATPLLADCAPPYRHGMPTRLCHGLHPPCPAAAAHVTAVGPGHQL